MPTLSLTRRAALVASLAAAAGLSLTGNALAHAHLHSSVPAANATVASPSSLTLKLSETIEAKFSGVVLTGPDKKPVALGAAALDPKDATTLVVPVTGTLAAGKYSVDWHVLSSDGHKTKGSFTFEVK